MWSTFSQSYGRQNFYGELRFTNKAFKIPMSIVLDVKICYKINLHDFFLRYHHLKNLTIRNTTVHQWNINCNNFQSSTFKNRFIHVNTLDHVMDVFFQWNTLQQRFSTIHFLFDLFLKGIFFVTQFVIEKYVIPARHLILKIISVSSSTYQFKNK